MKLRALGCHSGLLGQARPTCFLLGTDLLVNAGSATTGLTVEEQYKIDHILLTQAHLGQIQTIGFLADNVIGFRKGAIQVYTSAGNIEAIRKDFYNDKVWPDFTKIPTPDDPVMRFTAVAPGNPFEVGGRRIEPLENGGGPAVGFLIQAGGQAVACLAAPQASAGVWRKLAATEALRAVIVPTAEGGATPSDFAANVRRHFAREDVPFLLAHARPRTDGEQEAAWLHALNGRRVRFVNEGDEIDLSDPLAIPEADISSVHLAVPASNERKRYDGSLVIDPGNVQRQREIFDRFGRTYRKGDVVFREGEVGRELYIVQEGTVKLYKIIRGERRVIESIGSGEFFGEMAVLNAKPRSLTAEAATDLSVLIFPPDTFEALIVSNAGLAHRIIRTLASRLQNADNHIENLLYQDAESKLVNALLKLIESGGIAERGGVRLNLSPKDLSEQVGLPIEKVKQVISRLSKGGILEVQRTALFIADRAKLEKTLSYLSLKFELGIDAGV